MHCSTNLDAGVWASYTNGIAATPPLNTVTVDVSGAKGKYLRVELE